MNEQSPHQNRTARALAARGIHGTKEARDLSKTLTVLRWISTFGYSKTEILCQRLGTKNRELISQLAEQKLITLRQYPKVITAVLLTLKGKQFLEKHTPIRMRLCKRPNLNDVDHDLLAQRITCRLIEEAMEFKLGYWSLGPKGLTKNVQPRDKRADAEITYLQNGKPLKKIYIEVELNKKTGWRAFEFWQRIMDRIESDRRTEFRIYSYKKSILDFYRNELAQMQELGMKWYSQTEFTKKWVLSDRRIPVDMTFANKVSFHLEHPPEPLKPPKKKPKNKKGAFSLKKKPLL